MLPAPCSAKVSLLGVGCIHNRLRVCDIVDRCDAAVSDAETLVHNLDNWRQAVGSAACRRHNVVLSRVVQVLRKDTRIIAGKETVGAGGYQGTRGFGREGELIKRSCSAAAVPVQVLRSTQACSSRHPPLYPPLHPFRPRYTHARM